MVATIFLCLFLQVSVSFRADTIFTNQFLSGNETVISAVGVFELGFFKAGLRFAGLVDLGMASISIISLRWARISYNEKSMPYCNCLKGFVPKLESNWNLEDYSGECQRKTKLMCGNNISTNGLLVLKQTTEDKSTGKNLYVRLAASELRSSKENNMIGIGVVIGGVAGFAVLIGLIVLQLQSLNQGEKQFHAEVSTIGTIQHIDLVQLRGFCSGGTKRLLVYDYMSNGSLDSHLFHKKNLSFLKWETRYQIALGTTRGLLYPREKCRDCIVRYDIKPNNILLDAEFCPKVADFGMAATTKRLQTQV
ncbi:hypothetical protein FNV43_RR12902 [Rhamnella rubrinervis]|uniref:non-specific serine/threonine protein kinase n=1 Tax=Rhamnella rubrinervis TaxID=2594499 RepID=A0A8K0H062_9ROSA|nr:hypothetical protein FNV43_RR12902 [Rhamnella rubrinervis]